MSSNVSYDLIWQVSKPYSSYLVKSRAYGGAQFSAEPLNALSVYKQQYSGFASEQAFGVKHAGKSVKVISKDAKRANFPRKTVSVKKFSQKLAGSKQGDLIFAAATKANKLQRARGASKKN